MIDNGTAEVGAGLLILYAVIKLLEIIFEFIVKTQNAKKNDAKAAEASITNKPNTSNTFQLTNADHTRIMKIIAKFEAVEWKELERQIDNLHEWHSVENADGVKRWYVSNILRTNVADTRENVARLAIALEQLSSTTATNAELFSRLLTIVTQKQDK